MERVSVILGHQSMRVIGRHYDPWVHARQQQLAANFERVWARDPMCCTGAEDTRRIRENPKAVNWLKTREKNWYPGWESNPHEEKSPEDFKSSASAIPPPGRCTVIIPFLVARRRGTFSRDSLRLLE